jgi:hypothetical protein
MTYVGRQREQNHMWPEYTPKALIFVHMFKSGGTTINRVMDWEYSPNRIFSLNGRYCRWAYKRLTQLPPSTLAKMEVVRGHMPFGVHRLLPQPSTYMTILRDPVERILAEYFAGLVRRTHRQHRIIRTLKVSDFVATLANNNAQTKMIAGLSSSYDFLSDKCTSDTLKRAKANLREYFSLVGITERFEDTLSLAKCIFGWKLPYYASFNSTSRVGRVISPEMRSLIAEYNSFDVELYSYAVGIFDKAMARYAADIASVSHSVRNARLTEGPRLLYYRLASTGLKMFGLASSTVRCFLPGNMSEAFD